MDGAPSLKELSVGFVESISTSGVNGWAWSPADVAACSRVVLVVDGEAICHADANLFRQDLARSGIGNGNHGFSLAPGDKLLGPENEIKVVFESTLQELAISKTAVNWTPYKGVVEAVTASIIAGWVWLPERPYERIEVDIRAGTTPVGSAVADMYRRDLAEQAVGDGCHGFTFDLRPHPDVDPCDLSVYVSGTSTIINVLMPSRKREGHEPEVQSDGVKVPDLSSRPDGGTLMAFDSRYYRDRNADVSFAAVSPQLHYENGGWRQGRSPCAGFSVIHYLSNHEDVLLAGVDPFEHYVRDGRREGRVSSAAETSADDERMFRRNLEAMEKLLDQEYYRSLVPPLARSVVSPALHYLCRGWRMGLSAVPWFDVNYYLSAYPDVRSAGVEPLLHYGDFGRSEGRQATPAVRLAIESEFVEQHYLSQWPNLEGMEPIEHYTAYGWKQGLNPTHWFSSDYYLRLSPDVRAENINPFFHFLTSGRQEGRPFHPQRDRLMAEDPARPSIVLVGHDALHAGAEIVLLDLVRWLADRTRYPLKVLLLGLGPLVGEYARYADIFVYTEHADNEIGNRALAEFFQGTHALCYVNTVAAGAFAKIYDRLPSLRSVPLVVHVHELEDVINEFHASFELLKDRAASLIAVSRAVERCLREQFSISSDQIFLSHAFIKPRAESMFDVAQARASARASLQLSVNTFVVVGCGTVYHRKGPDLFIDVAEAFFRRDPHGDAAFIWFGSGADIGTCRSRCSEPALKGRVMFLGYRPNANELISAGDVLCLTSREDPFPLVCLEAAQYAIPTIFFEGATGISEFVKRDAGTSVPRFQTGAMATAARAYRGNRRLQERHGNVARTRVLEEYSAADRILEIFSHIRLVASLPPDVSVLVLGYNHENYVAERVESVLGQTLADTEILLMDDCSSDATPDVFRSYGRDPRVRLILNESNSGSPFKQWSKGVQDANSNLVWIAEGDDLCSSNLLEKLVPAFADPLVNIAFCKTQIINEGGELQHGALDSYYGLSDFPFHVESTKVDGLAAVNMGFGSMCLIVNASSSVMRKRPLLSGLPEAEKYAMCGDWRLYLHALRRAKLYYTAEASNFFRRHSQSAVHRLEGSVTYFAERDRIGEFAIENFRLSRKTALSMLAQLDYEWYRFRKRLPDGDRAGFYPYVSKAVPRIAALSTPRMRIGFYVHGMLFSKGGIEKVAALLANELVDRGHGVTIFCRDWGCASPVYSLYESVRIVSVFRDDDLEVSIPDLRHAIARCDLDVFVPMLSEWLFVPIVEAAVGLGVRVVASEHNDPWKIEELWWSRAERLETFRKVDAIHLLLQKFRFSLPQDLAGKVVVIPNGVAVVDSREVRPASERPPRIIALGRLVPQKRFDRLIRAFALIAEDVPEWTVHIFGEGEDRNGLQALIDQSGCQGRVFLEGITADPYLELSNSSVFVMPSEFEGFGMVVVEAMQSGLPCIAFASCNGPNELITDGVDGILVVTDDDKALASAVLELVNDPVRRARMGDAGLKASVRFEIETVADEWEEMLLATCQKQAVLF